MAKKRLSKQGAKKRRPRRSSSTTGAKKKRAGPFSLYPLDFDEALRRLVRIGPKKPS